MGSHLSTIVAPRGTIMDLSHTNRIETMSPNSSFSSCPSPSLSTTSPSSSPPPPSHPPHPPHHHLARHHPPPECSEVPTEHYSPPGSLPHGTQTGLPRAELATRA